MEFDGVSDYNSLQKNLVYFVNSATTYGTPLPPLSVTEISETSVLHLYPNPVKDELFIENNSHHSSYAIDNQMGQRVTSFSASNNGIDLINTSKLAFGIYILQANTDDGILQQKFVKQ